MKPINWVLACASAVVLSASAVQAQAAQFSSGANDLLITLTPLSQSSNPAIVFDPHALTQAQAGAGSSLPHSSDSSFESQAAAGVLSPVSSSATWLTSSGWAQSSGNLLDGGSTVQVEGFVDAAHVNSFASVTMDTGSPISFQLAPNTGLTLSADIYSWVSADDLLQRLSTTADIELRLGAGTDHSQFVYGYTTANAGSLNQKMSDSHATQVSLQLFNTSNDWETGTFSFQIMGSAYGDTVVSAVPEPPSGGLLLAGLGLMGLAFRRSRQRC